MSSIGLELPKEIEKVQEMIIEFEGLIGITMVEPQIIMMKASVSRAVNALSSGDVVEILKAYTDLKEYEW